MGFGHTDNFSCLPILLKTSNSLALYPRSYIAFLGNQNAYVTDDLHRGQRASPDESLLRILLKTWMFGFVLL
jgi:hypothetical protein